MLTQEQWKSIDEASERVRKQNSVVQIHMALLMQMAAELEKKFALSDYYFASSVSPQWLEVEAAKCSANIAALSALGKKLDGACNANTEAQAA